MCLGGGDLADEERNRSADSDLCIAVHDMTSEAERSKAPECDPRLPVRSEFRGRVKESIVG
jgi:hypothetical protein